MSSQCKDASTQTCHAADASTQTCNGEVAQLGGEVVSQDRKAPRTAEYYRDLRARKKIAEGFDPDVRRNAEQRPGESDSDFTKRQSRNASWVRWSHNKRDGVVKPKLTDTEKRAKKAKYVADRRARKRAEAADQD